MTAKASPVPAARGRRRLPGALLLLLALVVTGALWTVLAPRSTAATSGSNSYAIDQGHQLFLKGCASCHGLQAQGTGQAPSLIGVGAAAVDFQVSTGRMPLSAPGAEAERHPVQYTQSEIDQLAAYVASLAPGPAEPDVSGVTNANVAQGGELFRLNCAECHNFAGSGGALSYGKYAPSLSAATAKQIEEAMITGPENMPVFGPGQLNAQQRNDIAAYILTLRKSGNLGGNSIGRLGPVPEGLVIWILGIGLVVAATLWIGSRL